MSHTDSGSYKPFIWVLGSLVFFTFFIAFIANKYSPKTDVSSDPLVQQGLKQQIAPVGQSRVAHSSQSDAEQSEPDAANDKQDPVDDTKRGDDVVDTTDEAAQESEADASASSDNVAVATAVSAAVATVGADTQDATTAQSQAAIPVNVRAVVATNCAGCHQQGVGGAPRNDDSAAWNALAEMGVDALTDSVINGKGSMMPRAETNLGDEELQLAVSHMIAQNTSDAGESADQPVSESVAATTEKPVATAPESDATTAQVTTAAAVALSDDVKAVVDSLCAGCHISGVANAPKYGDKEAWEQRLSGGIDKVLASVIAGKDAMPARGGSQLSDAELRSAIEYMASK